MPIDFLPPDARATFQRLLERDLLPTETLLGHIGNYAAELDAAAERHEFLDHKLATNLIDHLRVLIDRTQHLDDDVRHEVQAAAQYLILTEDADNDFTSVTGLDDDVEVFNAVVLNLGHPDLTIEL